MADLKKNISEYNFTQLWDIMENITETGNLTNTSSTVGRNESSHLYIYLSILIFTLILTAVIFNVVILLSTSWIRRPISPTLQLSLSMTTSDSYTLLITAISIFINSLLPKGIKLQEKEIPVSRCKRLILECLRFGGLVTTFFHVFALAGNHYLGVKRPLHYSGFMTHRTITVLVILLWTLPPIVFAFVFYFFVGEDQGFRTQQCNTKFLVKYDFRKFFSLVVSIFIVLIVIMYMYIYIKVIKHQGRRKNIVRTPSQARGTRTKKEVGGNEGLDENDDKDKKGKNRNRSTRRKSSKRKPKNDLSSNKILEASIRRGGRSTSDTSEKARNEKAIFTTMLIVGSLVIGWTPALLYFALVCDDCPIIRNTYTSQEINILISSFCNILLITKTALNSYIYAARMQEIKTALKRMAGHCVRRCCRLCSIGNEEESQRPTRLSRTSTKRSTLICHINSSGQEQPLINGVKGVGSFGNGKRLHDETPL